MARQNRLARRTGLGEDPRIDLVEGARQTVREVAAGQIGLVGVPMVVDIVLEVGAQHTVLEVVAVRMVPGAVVHIALGAVAVRTGLVVAVVVDTVQERHNLVAVGGLHTGPEAGRRTDFQAAAHHIEFAVVVGRSFAEAGSLRIVGFALVAVDDSRAVEVAGTVDADRNLGAAGLL